MTLALTWWLSIAPQCLVAGVLLWCVLRLCELAIEGAEEEWRVE